MPFPTTCIAWIRPISSGVTVGWAGSTQSRGRRVQGPRVPDRINLRIISGSSKERIEKSEGGLDFGYLSCRGMRVPSYATVYWYWRSGVSVCVLVTTMSSAKTDEPIDFCWSADFTCISLIVNDSKCDGFDSILTVMYFCMWSTTQYDVTRVSDDEAYAWLPISSSSIDSHGQSQRHMLFCHMVGPMNRVGLSYSARCVLAPPDEYDGSICAAAAMRSVAAITVADVRISQPGEVWDTGQCSGHVVACHKCHWNSSL